MMTTKHHKKDNANEAAQGEADDPPDDKNLHLVCLFLRVVQTDKDYDLNSMIYLLNSDASALAAFKAVEL